MCYVTNKVITLFAIILYSVCQYITCFVTFLHNFCDLFSQQLSNYFLKHIQVPWNYILLSGSKL